jgi:hypothetical protein
MVPLQFSNGCNHIFTIVDQTSKWMEAILVPDTSVAACACALVFSWITRFRVPETITSDLGPQFTSIVWSQLCEMLHIRHRQTTAYHPKSNGAVKRLHRPLNDALCAHNAAATWAEEIPWVLFGLRAQPREDTGLSLAEAVFGAPIVLQINFCKEMKFLLTQFQNKFKNLLRVSCFFFAQAQFELPAKLGIIGDNSTNRQRIYRSTLSVVSNRQALEAAL